MIVSFHKQGRYAAHLARGFVPATYVSPESTVLAIVAGLVNTTFWFFICTVARALPLHHLRHMHLRYPWPLCCLHVCWQHLPLVHWSLRHHEVTVQTGDARNSIF